MDDRVKSIHWSLEADGDLDEIYDFYFDHSPNNASDKLLSIISETEEIIFTKQWQVDELNPAYRRIIVQRKFRVVYKVIDNIILITSVYPSKKNPRNFRKI